MSQIALGREEGREREIIQRRKYALPFA